MGFFHICPACERGFQSPVQQTNYCPNCRVKRRKSADRRYRSKKSNGGRLPRAEQNTCASSGCAAKIWPGRRLCRTCALRRQRESWARKERLQRQVEVYSQPVGDSVSGEMYGPSMTRGGY